MSAEDADLMTVSNELYQVTTELIIKGYKPFVIAAALTMIGMQIYKSCLSAQDYDKMVDSISEARNKVRSLDELSELSKNFSGSFH
jgi:hypothetical protein